jgi:hypothetical protein
MATAPPIPKATEDATPKPSYRSTRQFEMRETTFGKDTDEAINNWLYEQIETRRKQLKILHTNKVPEWRRIASGKPLEENKSWPFQNCSNLVHQVVGQTGDDTAARILGLIYATSPILIYRYFLKASTPQQAADYDEKARLLEQFMDYVCYEPEELDLYMKEAMWFGDCWRLGTAWTCVVPEKKVEAVYVGVEGKKTAFEEDTLYEGPKVVVPKFEDILFDPNANTPEESEFISRKCYATRRDLQERSFKGLYKTKQVELILGRPDRYGPGEITKRENTKKGIVATEERILAEWDIEECCFYWYHNKKKYRVIAWYHFDTKTVLNQVFNFIPDNRLPLVRTRLSNDEHGMIGKGYAEMLGDNQMEISTAKNQRNDAITWGILGINRISPSNKNIDRNFKVFPGANMPFGKDEFEHFEVANPAMGGLSLQNEAAMIAQAQERAGVGPAIAGMGAGGPNKKGQQSAMGTLAIMQDSNSRMNYRTSDFRHSHVKLGSLLTSMYGAMDLGRKGSVFGLDDKKLKEALNDFLEHKVRIPIRAATASANKEVDKQNKMLLMQALRAHFASQSQMLQAINNAAIPPQVKKWMTEALKSQDRLMRSTMRDFQFDQPEQYVPEIDLEENNGQAQAARPAGQPPMAAPIQQPGAGGGANAAPGVAPTGTGLPGQGQ